MSKIVNFPKKPELPVTDKEIDRFLAHQKREEKKRFIAILVLNLSFGAVSFFLGMMIGNLFK